jgi:hypothetical protein
MIYNEKLTRDFIETVLRPLENDEVYLLLLGARKKYCETLSRSQEILNRTIIRNNEVNSIINKINRMMCFNNYYIDKKTNEKIPSEAFVCYITINSNSTLKAYINFVNEMNNLMYGIIKNKNEDSYDDLYLFRKIDIKLFSSIHKSWSKKYYVIVDIDKKDDDILENVIDLLGENVKWVSETRGGYHVIVDKNKTSGKIIHTDLVNCEYSNQIEILKNAMTPVPGTMQGGFEVKKVRF